MVKQKTNHDKPENTCSACAVRAVCAVLSVQSVRVSGRVLCVEGKGVHLTTLAAVRQRGADDERRRARLARRRDASGFSACCRGGASARACRQRARGRQYRCTSSGGRAARFARTIYSWQQYSRGAPIHTNGNPGTKHCLLCVHTDDITWIAFLCIHHTPEVQSTLLTPEASQYWKKRT